MASTFTANWTIPTLNTDGSTVTVDEITGYELGVRSTTANGSTVGVYPILQEISDPSTTTLTTLVTAPPYFQDTYAVAVRTVGPTNSDWSNEATFTVSGLLPQTMCYAVVLLVAFTFGRSRKK